MKLSLLLVLLKLVATITAFGAINIFDADTNTYTLGLSTDVDLTGGNGNFDFDFSDGDLPDPTADTNLILNTSSSYTFTHVGSGHPFIVLSDAQMAPYNPNSSTGLRDSFPSSRLESDAYAIASSSESLYLVANSEDSFTWSPSAQDVGSYWFTCAIAGHRDFLGQIEVVAVPEPLSYSLLLGVLAIWIVSYRRCRW